MEARCCNSAENLSSIEKNQMLQRGKKEMRQFFKELCRAGICNLWPTDSIWPAEPFDPICRCGGFAPFSNWGEKRGGKGVVIASDFPAPLWRRVQWGPSSPLPFHL